MTSQTTGTTWKGFGTTHSTTSSASPQKKFVVNFLVILYHANELKQFNLSYHCFLEAQKERKGLYGCMAYKDGTGGCDGCLNIIKTHTYQQ